MNLKKLLLMLALIIGTTLILYSFSYAVSLEEGYDDEILTEEGTTSWEDDLEALEEREIERILNRIRAGDTGVMNYIVYQVFERLHYTVLAITLPTTDQYLLERLESRYPGEDHERFILRAKARFPNLAYRDGDSDTNYYDAMGGRNSVRAMLAGFRNQDPKVRLKCIGYLGDWVDEIGLDLETIEIAVGIQLGSGSETREEVKYALEILRLKILRKRVLKQIYLGDTNVLDEIPARDFVVLVKDERFIRDIYNIDDDVQVRSIRLDPYVESRAIDKAEAVAENKVADKLWRLDTFDFNYNNRNAFKAIFAGLENSSLFVKEHCVRLMLEMIFLATASDIDNPNNPAEDIISGIIEEGKITNGILADMSRQAAYIRLAQKTWDDVVFSTYGNPELDITYTGLETEYYDTNLRVNAQRFIEPYDTSAMDFTTIVRQENTITDGTVANSHEGDGTETTCGELGHYNYRVMVADLLRLMGLQWYLGEEEREVQATAIDVQSIEHLFDNPAFAGTIDRSDELEGEAPQIEED